MVQLRGIIGIVSILAIVYAGALPLAAQTMDKKMKPMGGMTMDKKMKPMGGMMMVGDAPVVPPVAGYSEGQKILFIHTETSDAKIAKILTDMMGGSPVLVVPSLAKAPKEMLARVYVFTNGMSGKGPMGPLGGQADVFEHPPGDAAYRPLRAVTLVTWKNAMSAEVLKSAAQVKSMIDKGMLTREETRIVVNMPFLTWPGGTR